MHRMAERVKELDLKGLKCPLPVLRTRKALALLNPGEILIISCTDPLSRIDIPNLVHETGDVVEEARIEDAIFIFRILRRG
jgi:tRNA 2-thiouridine synthesizing protein A